MVIRHCHSGAVRQIRTNLKRIKHALPSCRSKLEPLGESSVVVSFENVSARKVVPLVDVVADRGVNEGRFLVLAEHRCIPFVVNQTTAWKAPCQQTLKIGQMVLLEGPML